MVNWGPGELLQALRSPHLADCRVEERTLISEMLVTRSQIERWFGAGRDGRPGYGDMLRRSLSDDEMREVELALVSAIAGKTVAWRRTVLFVRARAPE